MLHVIRSRLVRFVPFRVAPSLTLLDVQSPLSQIMAPKRKRTAASVATNSMTNGASTNPQKNPEIIDAPDALRASPDSDVDVQMAPGPVKTQSREESPLSDVPDVAVEPPKKKRNVTKPVGKKSAPVTNGDSTAKEVVPKSTPAKKAAPKPAQDEAGDPEAEGEEEADEEEIQQALSRPPPINSSYLPLPWKGRLGFVCCLRRICQNQD